MYKAFASVYDKFMENTPYDEWVTLIEKIWAENWEVKDSQDLNGNGSKLILELGCGTGNVTRRLAEKGYDMIGIDSSQDMLSIAIQKNSIELSTTEEAKNKEEKKDILYLCQDMRSFELYGTVDSIICICDGINYLTKSSDVLKVFKLVKNYLNPGGIFIFDIITCYRYKKILGENNFSEINETSAFIWDNYFDKDSGINKYSVSFFIKNKKGLYERFDETHYQRAYSKKKISRLLEEAELKLINIYDESGGAENPRSERLFFAVKNSK